MRDATLVALSKVLARQAERVTLPPGVHPVDETLTLVVKGEVRKGQDVDYTPTQDIPLIPTLALVLERLGVQRERAKALITTAMLDALEAGRPAGPEIEARINDVARAMEHVRDITNALPAKRRAGPTTVHLDVAERIAA